VDSINLEFNPHKRGLLKKKIKEIPKDNGKTTGSKEIKKRAPTTTCNSYYDHL
jgi:hypothetical protein